MTTPETPETSKTGLMPRRIRGLIFIIMAINMVIWGLAVVSFVLHHHSTGPISTHSFTVYTFLSPSEEMSLGTWLSSMLWIAIAFLSSIYTTVASRQRGAWFIFAFVSLIASIDEFVMLHERLWAVGEGMNPGISLPFGFHWVIPGAVISFAVAGILLRLVLSLPSFSRWGLLGAGFIFVFSAVGMEFIAGRYSWSIGGLNDVYWRFMMVEEFLEVTALTLALAALTYLIQWNRVEGRLTIDLTEGIH